ncbi:MAG TPA: hypothetical protein VGR14_23920 [Verrucomicrobiae bacterium]|jgi:hypothetical protein|nr:hypothetical protein [Verrucomicrobiae bacterium]
MKRITVVPAENYRAVLERFWTLCEAKGDLEFDRFAANVGAVASAVFALRS